MNQTQNPQAEEP